MAERLLAESRRIDKTMAKKPSSPARFPEIARAISQTLESSCFIVGRRGIINGYAFMNDTPCVEIEKLCDYAECFPESFNRNFLETPETKMNITLGENRQCLFDPVGLKCNCNERIWAVIPVYSGDGRSGTIVLMRKKEPFTTEDIILAEHAALVLAVEVSRIRSERIQNQARKTASAQIAITNLSCAEMDAIEQILFELKGKEGLIVASRIADKWGITRSVIVSALKKLEAHEVIESRSLGVKGTYLRVLNDFLSTELKKHIRSPA